MQSDQDSFFAMMSSWIALTWNPVIMTVFKSKTKYMTNYIVFIMIILISIIIYVRCDAIKWEQCLRKCRIGQL